MSERLRNRDESVAGLVVETTDDFRVHGRMYTDPAIFALELDRIFGTTWVYVAHESEIPNAFDYKTASIGQRPVIVSRSEHGDIHVLLNRCRHRGSVLCRQLHGNARFHNCKYHGWVYGADGGLISMTLHQGGYPDDFDKSRYGLMRVPRVENYRGLIFASMAEDGPSLRDHLGPARRYLDHQLDRAPHGSVTVRRGTYRAEYLGNWKFQAENSTDGYHGNTVHESFWKILANFGNRGGQHGNYDQTDLQKILRRRESGCTHGFDNGHGILEYPIPGEGIEGLKKGPDAAYIRALEDKHGPEKLQEIMPQYNLWIFPNLGILLDQIRVVRPVAPDRTEVTLDFYELDGAPDDLNQRRFDGYERFFGPAAFGSPDDVEMFAMNQTGLQAKEVEWLLLSRGMGRETVTPEGVRVGHPTDETPQRAFHRMWSRLMASA